MRFAFAVVLCVATLVAGCGGMSDAQKTELAAAMSSLSDSTPSRFENALGLYESINGGIRSCTAQNLNLEGISFAITCPGGASGATVMTITLTSAATAATRTACGVTVTISALTATMTFQPVTVSGSTTSTSFTAQVDGTINGNTLACGYTATLSVTSARPETSANYTFANFNCTYAGNSLSESDFGAAASACSEAR